MPPPALRLTLIASAVKRRGVFSANRGRECLGPSRTASDGTQDPPTELPTADLHHPEGIDGGPEDARVQMLKRQNLNYCSVQECLAQSTKGNLWCGRPAQRFPGTEHNKQSRNISSPLTRVLS